MSEGPTNSYSVKVAPGVVAAVVRLAALGVPGVTHLAEGRRFRRFLPAGRLAGGVRLEVVDDSATIDLHVVVERDSDMRAVCGRVQRAVAEAVSNLVGMPVREVNVYVQDVQ